MWPSWGGRWSLETSPRGFLHPGFWLPDHGNRDLLRSGDIESNPGPLGSCSVCGGDFTRWSRPIRCVGSCGRQTHRKGACSGLRSQEAQQRGDWRCGQCTGGGGQRHGASPVASVNPPRRGGLRHGGNPVASVNSQHSNRGGGQGHRGNSVAPANSQQGNGGEGRDGGETPRPLLTCPGGEGRDIGETLWPLLTPYRVKPQSPLEPIPNRQVREVRFPGLYVGLVRRAG